MCHTFGQRPSTVMRELLGTEVPPQARSIDWYVFDVTAAAQVHALINKAQQGDDCETGSRTHSFIQEHGDTLTIHGTEIAPWERS